MLQNQDSSINTHLAGISVLNPFVPQLFRHLKYTDGNSFVNEAAKVRAFSLLSSLYKGDSALDSLLILVCELSLDDAEKVELDENELAELNKMLEAAISSWGSLKNISLAAFVKYWVNRQGILKETDEGIDLIVQRETGDILLDFIKWNISLIKFPWMDKPIRVEW